MSDTSAAVADFIDLLKQFPAHRTSPPVTNAADQIIRILAANDKKIAGNIEVRINLNRHKAIYSLPAHQISVIQPLPQDPQHTNEKYFKEFINLINQLPGKDVELDTTHQELPIKDSWDDWRKVAGDAYDKLIHPAVKKVIAETQTQLPTGSIVDLFGGDGRMVALLAKLPKLKNRPIYILDNHLPAINVAKQKLKAFKKIRVLKPVDLASSPNIFSNIDPPALVTIVGGICAGVVMRQEALNIMRQVYEALVENGICVVTGFTTVLLNAQDFQKLGFGIEQCSIPKNILAMEKPDQMYVLRK